ncbi:MAG: RNA polymerase sigma factor, partial [Acidimicrobiales bacterium]
LAIDRAVASSAYDEVDQFLAPIAAAASEGDQTALGLLIGLLDSSGIVRSTVAKYVHDNDLVDDACQDALIGVSRGIVRFEGRSRVTTWVHTIAANAARGALRKEGRHGDTSPDDELPETDIGLRRMSSIVVTRDVIRAAMAELPDGLRVPLELREFDDLSYADIGERLELEPGTVKSRISRARQQLATQLGFG